MLYIRGLVLEAGCTSVVYPRLALARCRIRTSPGTATKAHGVRHDRILHPEVLITSTRYINRRYLNRFTTVLLQRTDNAFQTWLKKGTTFNSTDYVLPPECCAMVNVILDAKSQSFKLCAVDGVDVVHYSFMHSFI